MAISILRLLRRKLLAMTTKILHSVQNDIVKQDANRLHLSAIISFVASILSEIEEISNYRTLECDCIKGIETFVGRDKNLFLHFVLQKAKLVSVSLHVAQQI